MSVAGLFLSGFFYYFPVSSLLFLGSFFLVLTLAAPFPRLLVTFLGGSFLAGILLFPPESPSPTRHPILPVDLCIDALPSLSQGGLWVTGKEEGAASLGPERINLYIPENRLPEDPLVWGDCLSTEEISLLPSRPNGFSLSHGIPSYILSVSGSLRILPNPSFSSRIFRTASRLSRKLSERLRADYPSESAGLLSALVLSDTRFLSSNEIEDFRRAGVSHLLSVSGEHMTLLGLFLGGTFLLMLRLMPLSLLRSLSVRFPVSRVLFVLLLPFLGFYTLMIGFPPAAVRAFLGFSLLAVLRLVFVDLAFSDILGLSTLIMLVFSPSLARSLSFLLSLLALWGLVLHQRNASEKLYKSEAHPLKESFQAGLFITLLTAPLLALVFRTANPAGIISNPVLVPVAGDLLLPLGFFDLILLLILPHTPTTVLVLTASLTHIVLGLAHGFSLLPGSEVPVRGGSPALVLLFYLSIILLLVIPKGSLRRFFLPIFFLLTVTILLPDSPRRGGFVPAIISENRAPLTYEPERERANLVRLLMAHPKGRRL